MGGVEGIGEGEGGVLWKEEEVMGWGAEGRYIVRVFGR